MDVDDDEFDLPVFRHFTRDDLADIHHRLFENKLLEKKKAEKLAKNKAEFGEGARARKNYKNDSDDEDDDEGKPAGPNPKLAQGADLPKRFGQFPMEMSNIPLCDIDPYFDDQLTFIVIKEGGGILRYSATPSFFVFSPFHPVRRLALSIFSHWFFDFFIISTILANCWVMMQPDSPGTAASEIIFTAIYTFEAMVKLAGRGFFINKHTFLRDAWNWLDFVVVTMSYVSLVVDLSQFAAVRTVRVFRALKSVNVVPGLKKIVGAIVYSVENLKDVIILTIFILAVFALLGLQVYMGVLTRICIVDYYDVVDVNSVINETTSDYADVTVMNWIAQNDLVHWKYSQTGTGYNKSVTKEDWVKNQSTWYVTEGYSSHSANYILCNNGSGTGACPLGTICIEGNQDANPNYGYTNFDNMYWAYLSAFRLMTQDFWENLYQIVLRVTGPMHIIFFIANIFLGSFYLINLILAIVAMSYDELQRIADQDYNRELEELEAIKAAETIAIREAEIAVQDLANDVLDFDALGDDSEESARSEKKDTDGKNNEHETNSLSQTSTSSKTPTGNNAQGVTTNSPMKPLSPPSYGPTITSQQDIRTTTSATTMDIRVLNDVVERVSISPSTESRIRDAVDMEKRQEENDWNDEEDDEDPGDRYKRLAKEKAAEWTKILCIWDCAWIWIRVSEVLSFIVFDAFTEVFITLCIIVNIVFMALNQYELECDNNDWTDGGELDGMCEGRANMLIYGNYFFTAVFAVESFIKMAAMSPKYFFADSWNVFDFVIVALSLVELLFENVKSLSMLRSFRLLRVFKLAKSWKSLNDILTIMAKTLGSLAYLTAVLLIIIFIFAVMGMQLFGDAYPLNACRNPAWNCEIPRWHFIDFFHSFLIVFRVLCGEWIESMWDCLYVTQGPLCVPYFLIVVLVAGLVILNLFLALLLSSFSDMGGDKKEDEGPDKIQVAIMRIKNFKSWLVRKIKGLCSKRRVSAVGANPVLMNGNGNVRNNGPFQEKEILNGTTNGNLSNKSNGGLNEFEMKMNKMNQFDDEYQTKIGHGMDVSIPMSSTTNGKIMMNGGTNNMSNGGFVNFGYNTFLDQDKDFHHFEDGQQQYIEDDIEEYDDYGKQEKEIFFIPIGDIPVEDCCPDVIYRKFPWCEGGRNSPFWIVWDEHRMLGSKLIENKYFETVVLALILLSSGVMTLEDITFESKPMLVDTLFYLDKILTVVFLIETCIKLFSMGFVAYFSNAWCWLDFVIVGVSLVNFSAGLLGFANISIFKTMRTLRALRPLRAMAKMEGMKVVVNALVGALPDIFNVLVVCVIFWLIFAIIGINLFKGKFFACWDTELGERYTHDIIPNRTVCIEQGLLDDNRTVWKMPDSGITFDNVWIAYIALFQIATWKGWTAIMDNAIDTRGDIGEQPYREANLYMYMYFVFFILFGSFFTLNLLVGVIIDKFNEQKNKGGSSLDEFMTDGQKKYIQAMKKASTKKPLKALPRPTWGPQKIAFAIIANKKFDMLIMAFIGLNMATMCCEHYNMSDAWTFALENFNVFFIVVFTAEMLLKMFALRQYYFTVSWNNFDFVVVMLSLMSLFLEDLMQKYSPVSPTLLRVVRVAKVGRVLRLIKGAKGIRTLLFSLVMAFPALLNICLLLFLVMFIFAVFGMSMFKKVKLRFGFDDVHNFQTFFKTFTLLFQISTSAGWSDAFEAISWEDTTDCEMPNEDTGFEGTCGQFGLGAAYMLLYLTLSFLIIVNMYIAVILENYSQASEDVADGIIEEDYALFYEIWQEFDPEGTMYMSFENVPELLDCLEQPLQIKLPNKYKIVQLDIPIIKYTNPTTKEVQEEQVFCTDILDLLTQDFFSRKSTGTEVDTGGTQGNTVETVTVNQFPDRPGYEKVSSSQQKQRECFSATIIKRCWKHHRQSSPSSAETIKNGGQLIQPTTDNSNLDQRHSLALSEKEFNVEVPYIDQA